jgi:translation initiation factor IF-2
VIPRNAPARLPRDNVEDFTGKLSPLPRYQDDATAVPSALDRRITLDGYQDVTPGDEIESFVREEVAQTL